MSNTIIKSLALLFHHGVHAALYIKLWSAFNLVHFWYTPYIVRTQTPLLVHTTHCTYTVSNLIFWFTMICCILPSICICWRNTSHHHGEHKATLCTQWPHQQGQTISLPLSTCQCWFTFCASNNPHIWPAPLRDQIQSRMWCKLGPTQQPWCPNKVRGDFCKLVKVDQITFVQAFSAQVP